uniref:Major sperm protein n=1 Tax=Ditylenchus dipsaci TaxID=166011 RepID=A0A915DQN3_9BILA
MEEEQATRVFLLKIVPKEILEVNGNLLDRVDLTLSLTNKSDTALSYKVKCTSNEMFSIKPSVGCIDVEKTAYVKIRYRCHQDRIPLSKDGHHFSIYHIPVPVGSYAEGAWKEHYGPAQGEKRLKVSLCITRSEKSL